MKEVELQKLYFRLFVEPTSTIVHHEQMVRMLGGLAKPEPITIHFSRESKTNDGLNFCFVEPRIQWSGGFPVKLDEADDFTQALVASKNFAEFIYNRFLRDYCVPDFKEFCSAVEANKG